MSHVVSMSMGQSLHSLPCDSKFWNNEKQGEPTVFNRNGFWSVLSPLPSRTVLQGGGLERWLNVESSWMGLIRAHRGCCVPSTLWELSEKSYLWAKRHLFHQCPDVGASTFQNCEKWDFIVYNPLSLKYL
jgi:hypothetical protein